jgi:hypothetical protein
VRSRKRRIALGALAACALAWPASASGQATPFFSFSVTGDDGVPQALNAQTLRNMSPQIGIALGTAQSYSLYVTGPAGQLVSAAPSCNSPDPMPVTYQGNGVYTVTVVGYAGPGCSGAAGMDMRTFSIGAGVAIASDPNTPLLTREPDEFANVEHRLPFTGNPGADTYDVRYSTSSRLRANGGLAGSTRTAIVDAATSTVPIRFSKPGRYTVVARARVFGGATTPWTAPLSLRVYAPFDFASSSFPDATGPSYALRVKLRERSARGRVRISVARRWTGRARYRSVGSVRIRSGGFTKRFRLAETGTYRIRYRFEGSGTTAPGTVVERVRIRRSARASAAGIASHTLRAR